MVYSIVKRQLSRQSLARVQVYKSQGPEWIMENRDFDTSAQRSGEGCQDRKDEGADII